MKRKVVELAEFWDDLASQFAWYEGRRAGLGDEFIDEVSEAIDRCIDKPEAYREIEPNLRRIRLHRFPFKVVFALEPRYLVFVGILHDAQDLRAWLAPRLGKH